MVSRELFICIGITMIVAAGLFFYIQHKFRNVDVLENKIDTLFTVVQNEASKREKQYQQQSIKVSETCELPSKSHSNIQQHQSIIQEGGENNIKHIITEESDKIVVSDDEYSDVDDESDLESLSDDESSIHEDDIVDDDNSVEKKELHIHNIIPDINAELTEINVIHKDTLGAEELESKMREVNTIEYDTNNELKSIELQEESMFDINSMLSSLPQNNESINVGDIDELQSEQLDSTDIQNETIQVNDVESDLNDSDDEEFEFSGDESELSDEQKNWNKMKVAELRDLVSEKQLHETPKKLKKAELIEILEGNNN
jgi:hypothetical protein